MTWSTRSQYPTLPQQVWGTTKATTCTHAHTTPIPKPGKRSPAKLNPTNETVYEPHPFQRVRLQPAPMPVRPQSPNLANKTVVNNNPTNGIPVDEYHVRTTPTAAGVIV
ncbi:hypothetical protein BS47DRAFT_1368847 [Hydnum rufescens UP504]|uniref:Uncharacterized protein n=1 Tax=Hydnum rufescens UP504 TaxID=1448309 RepID=A0A9P6AER3_9AGAM|nr:hypothetical protein BS47DRAFT_1368847 [Hydnum rufescens UP504]